MGKGGGDLSSVQLTSERKRIDELSRFTSCRDRTWVIDTLSSCTLEFIYIWLRGSGMKLVASKKVWWHWERLLWSLIRRSTYSTNNESRNDLKRVKERKKGITLFLHKVLKRSLGARSCCLQISYTSASPSLCLNGCPLLSTSRSFPRGSMDEGYHRWPDVERGRVICKWEPRNKWWSSNDDCKHDWL